MRVRIFEPDLNAQDCARRPADSLPAHGTDSSDEHTCFAPPLDIFDGEAHRFDAAIFRRLRMSGNSICLRDRREIERQREICRTWNRPLLNGQLLKRRERSRE